MRTSLTGWVRGLAAALALVVMATGAAGPARAQGAIEGAFVQLEAHPDLATAETRVRAYSQIVPDIRAFRLASGWYGIAIGPYEAEAAAAERLQTLAADGLVPGDAYVESRPIYLQQVFPAGALPAPVEAQAITEAQASPGPEPEPEPEPQIPEETLAEARQSEFQLDRTQREAIQIALQWFGFYDAGIDAAFGPGTRAAMQAWQAERGLEPTGVLTTRQRARLLDAYRGELDALGMRVVTDTRAGIEMNMPMAMVEFDRYEFPFAQYGPVDDSGVRILLISQEGTSRTLAGLYEILQTLEVVPLRGERSRDADSFVLTGQSASLRSHTIARLQDGRIKGFMLIWPPERDAQMARVLPMMEESFTPIPGVLDPGAVSEEATQDVDLVAGLEVRTPEIRRSGFYATQGGVVVTTTEVDTGMCERFLLDDVYEAEVALRDEALGLLVLRPVDRLAPPAFGRLSLDAPRLRSRVAIAGFPYDGALGAASLNYGELADVAGLDGDDRVLRLAVETEAGEAGGPVLDAAGRVIGMLQAPPATGRTLPPGVAFALDAETLAGVLADGGLSGPIPAAGTAPEALGAQALARQAAALTVLVSCWN